MKIKFQGDERVRRAQLNRLKGSFEMLAMKHGEIITNYFTRTMVIANEMRSYGEDMEDVKIVEKILWSLTEKWNYVVCSIEESKDTSCLSVDSLQSSLLVHKQKFKKEKDGDDEQALKATHDDKAGGKGRGRFAAKGRGHGRRRTSHYKENIECYKCHKFGHFQSECPDWKRESNYVEEEEEELLFIAVTDQQTIAKDEELLPIAPAIADSTKASPLTLVSVIIHFGSTQYDYGMMLMTLTQAGRKDDAWFLDSGYSNHMCEDRKWFSRLDTTFNTSVKLGNNTRMRVTGKR
eukprot:XP_025015621.1 uncharacterized protein LOC112536924 [Ricinus communis]